MTDTEKLNLILEHVNSITSLIEGNKYEQYFVRHLIPIQVEAERQIALIADGKEIL
jgi:hypothetical protein